MTITYPATYYAYSSGLLLSEHSIPFPLIRFRLPSIRTYALPLIPRHRR
jgi:hypothetical protein